MSDASVNWFDQFCTTAGIAIAGARAANTATPTTPGAGVTTTEATTEAAEPTESISDPAVEALQDAASAAYTQVGQQLHTAAAALNSAPAPDVPGAAAAVPGVLTAVSDLAGSYIAVADAISNLETPDAPTYTAGLEQATAPARAAEAALQAKALALRDAIGTEAAATVEKIPSCALLG